MTTGQGVALAGQLDAAKRLGTGCANGTGRSSGSARLAGSGQETEGAEIRRIGRPRSEEADRAIIEATLDLFALNGAEGLCIEKVATRAGVGKATIYRRWPGKEDLLICALDTLRTPLPEPRGASVREDLATLVEAMRVESGDPRWVRQIGLGLGDSADYPRLLEWYLRTVVEPRRVAIRTVLRRGLATGELREEISIETAIDMLTGAVLARAQFGRERNERGYARRLVEELLTGLASR